MKITFDEKVLKEYNLSFSQLIFLLSQSVVAKKEEIIELVDRGLIGYSYIEGMKCDNKFFLAPKTNDFLDEIIVKSSVTKSEKDRLYTLAYQLQQLFPEGKKGNWFWRGSAAEIRNKLFSFFKKFGEYSDEEILEATKRYVESYQHDRTFMHILKYFIWKRVDGEDKSELASWIENMNQDANVQEIKTTRLV